MSKKSTKAGRPAITDEQPPSPEQAAGRERSAGVEPSAGPEEHSDALLVDEEPLGPPSPDAVELTVGRGVIVEVARLAALEIPDVLAVSRRGPRWRAALAGPPIKVHVRKEGVELELRIIARPGADLVSAGRRVRDAVGRAVERLLGLKVRSVTVLIDGVGT